MHQADKFCHNHILIIMIYKSSYHQYSDTFWCNWLNLGAWSISCAIILSQIHVRLQPIFIRNVNLYRDKLKMIVPDRCNVLIFTLLHTMLIYCLLKMKMRVTSPPPPRSNHCILLSGSPSAPSLRSCAVAEWTMTGKILVSNDKASFWVAV